MKMLVSLEPGGNNGTTVPVMSAACRFPGGAGDDTAIAEGIGDLVAKMTEMVPAVVLQKNPEFEFVSGSEEDKKLFLETFDRLKDRELPPHDFASCRLDALRGHWADFLAEPGFARLDNIRAKTRELLAVLDNWTGAVEEEQPGRAGSQPEHNPRQNRGGLKILVSLEPGRVTGLETKLISARVRFPDGTGDTESSCHGVETLVRLMVRDFPVAVLLENPPFEFVSGGEEDKKRFLAAFNRRKNRGLPHTEDFVKRRVGLLCEEWAFFRTYPSVRALKGIRAKAGELSGVLDNWFSALGEKTPTGNAVADALRGSHKEGGRL